MTLYKITAKLNIPWSIGCIVLKIFQFCKIILSPKSSGRPCKLQMLEKRQIGRLLAQNSQLPLRELIKQFIVKVCTRTLNKAIGNMEFCNCSIAK
jgi:hypothetical protein